MATTLSFKSFFVDKTAKFPIEFVEEWLNSIDRGTDHLRLEVTLKSYGNTRKKKSAAMAELDNLLAVHKVLTGKNRIYRHKQVYCFDFTSKKYYWNRKEIYLTGNEQLFLYRWLVLENDDICKKQMFYLRNMRKRLGKEFLTEIKKERKNDNT